MTPTLRSVLRAVRRTGDHRRVRRVPPVPDPDLLRLGRELRYLADDESYLP